MIFETTIRGSGRSRTRSHRTNMVSPKLALMDATWTISLAPINNIRVLTAFGLVYLTARSNPRH